MRKGVAIIVALAVGSSCMPGPNLVAVRDIDRTPSYKRDDASPFELIRDTKGGQSFTPAIRKDPSSPKDVNAREAKPADKALAEPVVLPRDAAGGPIHLKPGLQPQNTRRDPAPPSVPPLVVGDWTLVCHETWTQAHCNEKPFLYRCSRIGVLARFGPLVNACDDDCGCRNVKTGKYVDGGGKSVYFGHELSVVNATEVERRGESAPVAGKREADERGLRLLGRKSAGEMELWKKDGKEGKAEELMRRGRGAAD